MAGMLYLVPTPIGNLGDLSRRCIETLQNADFIAAEDTRVSVKLLNYLDFKKPLVSYHEHNKEVSGRKILDRLQQGEVCALVTDAGTPAISDPGEDLVRLCARNQIPVCSVPGPCAAITALSVSALPTRRFTFEGFLPAQKKERRLLFEELKSERRTMIFYEAPHRLRETLNEFTNVFGGERKISLCRELTKLHEEILRSTLAEASAFYETNDPRGEYVLVIAGAEERQTQMTLQQAIAVAKALMQQGFSCKDAAKQAAAETGFPKNQLYSALLEE